MSNPLISVVLTTYNEMPYKLPIAVYSLLDQTFQDFELFIFHDGGEDKSYKDTSLFIEKLQDEQGFNDKAITFIATREKQGQWGYPLRQESLKHIQGSHVVFSNADNYHCPTYLEYFALEIQKDPEVALIHSNMVHNYALGKPYQFFPTQPGIGAIDLAAYCSRADLVKELGFGTWAGADGELAAKLATRGRVVHIDAVTVTHN